MELLLWFYAPASVSAKVGNGIEIHIEEETNYPFEDEIRFMIDPDKTVDFTFELRIPGWCKDPSVMINGKPVDIVAENNIIKLKRTWHKNDIVVLKLPMEISTSRWHEGSVAIERGPLLYALKIQEEWKEKKNDEWEDTFYEVYPKSPWNYGIPKKTLRKKGFYNSI